LFFVATDAHIFLDESGDTGWSFALPYQRGGSSRFFVISACSLQAPALAKPEQLVRRLHKNRQWKDAGERKWARMSPTARTAFAASAAKLALDSAAINLLAVVLEKRHVPAYARQGPNQLYNYMVKRLLLPEMARYDRVHFWPDERALPASSGNSLHDYLQTELWFGISAATRLETRPIDSRHSPNLQFVDMVSGVIHSHFEFGEARNWALLEPHVRLEKLNFE
jgi:hypothetical protein